MADVVMAHIILLWHREFGFQLAAESPDDFDKEEYRDVVQTLEKKLESDPNAARDVAQIQLDGILAKFSHKAVPQEMIAEAGLDELAHRDMQVRLHEIAEMILRAEEIGEPGFKLPQGWEDQSIPLKPQSKRLRNVQEMGLENAVAGEYTELFNSLRKRGLGGRDVMIAAHQSAYRGAAKDRNDEREDSIEVFSPASFNFQLATGAGRLVTEVLKHRVHLTQVVVGVQPDWAIRTGKEQ